MELSSLGERELPERSGPKPRRILRNRKETWKDRETERYKIILTRGPLEFPTSFHQTVRNYQPKGLWNRKESRSRSHGGFNLLALPG